MAYMKPEMRWDRVRLRISEPPRQKRRRKAVCIVPTVWDHDQRDVAIIHGSTGSLPISFVA